MKKIKIQEIIEILEILKNKLNMDQEIKLVVKPYKKRLAFVFLDKNVIYLNEKILHNRNLIIEALWHELLHLKYRTRWHTKEFFEPPKI